MESCLFYNLIHAVIGSNIQSHFCRLCVLKGKLNSDSLNLGSYFELKNHVGSYRHD